VTVEKRMEVVRMVERLNLAISKCAPCIAAGLPFRTSDTISDSTASKHLRAMSRFAIREFIGDAIISMLEAARGMKNVALQIAIRACLVSCCNYVISFWDKDHRSEKSTQELYRGLKKLGG
jgi:hypothetical protein